MKILTDYRGALLRLTDERLAHILDHPEMVGMEWAIEQAIASPQIVIESRTDNDASLYYRYYTGTRVGEKFLCVVVKSGDNDAFIVTAYLTDKVKQGVVLWNAKP